MRYIFPILIIATLLIPSQIWAQIPEKEYFPDGLIKIDWYFDNDGALIRKEYYASGGLMSEARYVDKKIDGLYRSYNQLGDVLAEINYKNGIEHGPFKEYSSSGIIARDGNYKDGMFDGVQRIFDDSGNLVQEVTYKNNVQDGRMQNYYPGGVLKDELYYKNGELSGLAKFYDERGKIKAESEYAENLRHGVTKEYYEDGNLRSKMNFAYDALEGEFVEYYPNGQIKVRDVIQSGKVIDRKVFDEFGKLKKENSFSVDELTAEIELGLLKHAAITDGIEGKLRRASREVIIVVIALMFLFIGVFVGTVISGSKRQESKFTAKEINDVERLDQISTRREFNVLNPESEKMYRSLVETVKSGIFMSDINGGLFYVNNTFAQIFGFRTKQDVIGLNLNKEFKSIDNGEQQLLKVMGESNELHDFQFKYQKKSGDVIVISASANRIFDESGKCIGIQGVVLDITEKNRLEEEIKIEKRKMESILGFFEDIDAINEMSPLMKFCVTGVANILESGTCLVLLEDEETRQFIVKGNRGVDEDIARRIHADSNDPILGHVLIGRNTLFVENIEYDKRWKNVARPPFLGRSFIIAPLEFEDKIKGVIIVTLKRTELQMDIPYNQIDLKILNIIAGKMSSTLEKIQLYDELNVKTVVDPITKVYNYRLLSESLDREIEQFKREQRPFFVYMMDIDDFKSYNDTFGHLEGDELLINLGKILNAQVRKTDIVCRYAGDEFCVVLSNTTLEGAVTPAQKIIKAVEEFQFKRVVTVSIGIAGYEEGMTKKDLIAKADKALYEAKHGGKNNYVVA